MICLLDKFMCCKTELHVCKWLHNKICVSMIFDVVMSTANCNCNNSWCEHFILSILTWFCFHFYFWLFKKVMKSKMTDQMTLLDNEQPTNKQTWYHVVEQTRDYVINVNLFCYAPSSCTTTEIWVSLYIWGLTTHNSHYHHLTE